MPIPGSQSVPLSHFPHAHVSVLCICISIPALEIGSSVPVFQITHICFIPSIRYLFYSFRLTSLCMTDSWSIHISTNDPALFFFYGWVVNFSHSVVSNSLWPHGLQHTRLPSPSPTPRACSNSGPLSQWCRQTISSSVIPFSSCLLSLPASESFQMSQFFTSGGQSIGVSA